MCWVIRRTDNHRHQNFYALRLEEFYIKEMLKYQRKAQQKTAAERERDQRQNSINSRGDNTNRKKSR